MKELKIIPVSGCEEVMQVTLRDVLKDFYLIFEENIVEYYSSDKEKLIQLIKNLKIYSKAEQQEIIEITPQPIFEHSYFIDSLSLMNQSYVNYFELETVLKKDIEIMIIQGTEILQKNRKDLLVYFLQYTQTLRVILFLTEGTSAQLLPLVQSKCITLPMLDVVDLRKHYGRSYKNSEKIYQFIQFNLMR